MNGLGALARRAGALVLVASLAGTAGAQQPASSAPWRAWLGCWAAGEATPLGLDAAQPMVCITPTADANAVKVTTIADGKVVSAKTVDASGRAQPLDAKGCTGSDVGRWSADGRRVYLNATATCDGVTHTTSGILAMTADGQWLDVQGVMAGGTEQVHVARYRDIGLRSNVPADIADLLRDSGMSVQSARVVAGADIGTTGVVEAAKSTSLGVAEAFVLERGQHFQLDARQLVALADAGVSPRLTDAMIAVSNPQTFAVNRPSPRADTVDVTGRRVYVMLDRYAGPWDWGYSGYGYSPYGLYSPYGYNAFGSPYGYGYGYGYGYPYSYSGPVVIVRANGAPAEPHGRVVKGRGYVRGDPPTPSTPDRIDSRSSGSSSSGASSSGSRPASSSSGSTDRTAKPRP